MDECIADAGQIVDVQQIAFWGEHHVCGHAVSAAQIAPVGDRKAQEGDGPAKAVGPGRARRLASSGMAGLIDTMEPVQRGIAPHWQVAGHVTAERVPRPGIGGANSGENGYTAHQCCAD